MSGVMAIVGRPNVGKSALFNRLAGRRIAIVHDQPGVTRDRIAAEVEWRGRPFTLIDTGGLGVLRREKAQDTLIQAAIEQVQVAIDAAQVILFVVNVQEGVVPLDAEVAKRLRACGKPVLLVINKVDTPKAEPGVDEFAELGFEQMFPVSAIHGGGIDALMTAAVALLPPGAAPAESSFATGAAERRERHQRRITHPPGPAAPLKIAVVGRPNVGKSSIINALTQSKRVIVSPIPGTTRDAVDVPFTVETDGVRQRYLLIDTAGLRKTRRVGDSIEFFSVMRAEESIARCDLALLVLDAESGITEQDKKVADRIVDCRKACVVVVNKWDLVAESVRHAREEERARRHERVHGARTLSTLEEFGRWVQEKLFFLDYAPVIFTAATSGFHLERLLEAIRYVAAQLQQRIPTSVLNRTLHEAVERRQPVSKAGHRLKFFYATQRQDQPPTFLLFVNRVELFSLSYKKYLSDELRRAFGFEGCPLVLKPKARPKTIEPRRDHRHRREG